MTKKQLEGQINNVKNKIKGKELRIATTRTALEADKEELKKLERELSNIPKQYETVCGSPISAVQICTSNEYAIYDFIQESDRNITVNAYMADTPLGSPVIHGTTLEYTIHRIGGNLKPQLGDYLVKIEGKLSMIPREVFEVLFREVEE